MNYIVVIKMFQGVINSVKKLLLNENDQGSDSDEIE